MATIILDQTHNTFTNLDVLSGRVVLRLESSTNVNSVVIKLEGESQTRLKPPPKNSDDHPKTEREVHKVRTSHDIFLRLRTRLLSTQGNYGTSATTQEVLDADCIDSLQTSDGVSAA